jgi:hypothetical protein
VSYIFNKNHNRTHLHGCRAVDMMNREKNQEIIEEPRGHSCAWCQSHSGFKKFPARNPDHGLDPYIGEKICHDHQISQTLKKFGCSCGSHKGDVRMYPHNEGYQVPGEPGKWWIYFHCHICGHDTSLSKVPPVTIREVVGVKV